MPGHLDLDRNILISIHRRIVHGHDPLALQTDLCSGLHPLTDLAYNIAVKSADNRFPSENSVFPAVHSRHSPAFQTDSLSCIYSRGNAHLK